MHISGLFTRVRGIRILRTSPFGDSRNFAITEFSEVHSQLARMLQEIKIVSKERHTPSRFIAPYYYAALQGEERKPSKKGKPVVSRAQNPKASSSRGGIRVAQHRIGELNRVLLGKEVEDVSSL
jgi:hypothetical protein